MSVEPTPQDKALVAELVGADITPHFSEAGRLPLFLTPREGSGLDQVAAAIARFHERSEGFQALLDHFGAVVLRGFGIADTDDFLGLTEAWPAHELGYVGGGAPRSAIKGRAMESTRYREDRSIPLHQEMAYLPHYPTRLAFFCKTPSLTGGETPIGDMRRLEALLPDDIRKAVEERGILHSRWYSDESQGYDNTITVDRSWREAFYTDDRQEVERSCAAAGMTSEWLPDGSLQVQYRINGFKDHPRLGERIWFNQIHIMTPSRRLLDDSYDVILDKIARGQPLQSDTRFGDGGTIPQDLVETLIDLYSEVEVKFAWQAGDVMLVDNFTVAHGRSPFTGPREVQVALFA